MKYCPSCNTEYADDTLQFCLQDGTRLAVGSDEPPTVAFGEPETVISQRNREKMRFDIPNSTVENTPLNRVTREDYAPVEAKKSNTAKVILLTVFGMLLLFGAIGTGAWFYLKKGQPEIAKNTNNAPNTTTNSNQTFDNDLNKNSAPKKTPTPKTQTNTAVSNVFTNTETPVEIDTKQIKEEVSESVNNWKAHSESGDLDAYMNSYADTVDYYKKSGASRSFVRADKQRAFTKFDAINVSLSNVSITPDASGERATAVFDKEWSFSGAEGGSSGKVRQQLSLKKVGGKWLITGEKDVKVYYLE
jgi:ketosteroid isomerase-like protein